MTGASTMTATTTMNRGTETSMKIIPMTSQSAASVTCHKTQGTYNACEITCSKCCHMNHWAVYRRPRTPSTGRTRTDGSEYDDTDYYNYPQDRKGEAITTTEYPQRLPLRPSTAPLAEMTTMKPYLQNKIQIDYNGNIFVHFWTPARIATTYWG